MVLDDPDVTGQNIPRPNYTRYIMV